MSKVTTVFIGNPGVGKSTILNCYLGTKAKFSSGVSFGEGMTKLLQEYKHTDGNTYIDTPGLSDIKLRKQAAQEIEKALKHDGKFQIIFVITLEAGRVRPDDKTTMELVLRSAPQIGSNFNILINKVPAPTYKKLKEVEEDRKTLITCLSEGLPHTTTSIYLNKKNEALEDADNELVPLDGDVKSFLDTALQVVIQADKVKPIEVNRWEQMNELLSKQLDEMKRDRKLLEKRMIEQEKRFVELLERQNAARASQPPRDPNLLEATGNFVATFFQPWKWF